VELTHVAMSVPPGGLSDDCRASIIAFYGEHLGWTEMVGFRAPDRLTLAVGRTSYVNIRERRDAMSVSGYEHVGVRVGSLERLHELAEAVAAAGVDEVGPVEALPNGSASFRFRHLLPLAIEVQYLRDWPPAT
jgi:hypothetical protein